MPDQLILSLDIDRRAKQLSSRAERDRGKPVGISADRLPARHARRDNIPSTDPEFARRAPDPVLRNT